MVEAKQLIKAYGFEIKPNDPLEISSERVQSVSPDFCDMRCDEMRDSDTPVWIIGGGKTAMDTAHALITEYPGREVNLVAGSGTYFAEPRARPSRRGPTMVARHVLRAAFALEVTRRFDGTNETECRKLVPRHLRHLVDASEPANFLLGVLSEVGEQDDCSRPQRRDHGPLRGCRRPQRRYRSGVPKRIHQDDRTGQLDRELHRIPQVRRPHPYEPYISGGGAVLSIQPRSVTLPFDRRSWATS